MTTMVPGRGQAEHLDAGDPLRSWRDEFVIADPELIYLDGNSLGMTPKRTIDALHDVLEEQWAGDLITSWWKHDWLDLPLRVGGELAPLIGARAGEVALHDSTTVCLFQLVNVALDLHSDDTGAPGGNPEHRDADERQHDERHTSARDISARQTDDRRSNNRRVVAVADDEFPTDRYVVEGIARLRPEVEVRRGIDDLDGIDVVVRSLVDYRTAALVSMADETARAASAGTITVWDLSHAAGVVAVDLEAAGADLAVGCTYKFLNGGPGAPAFTFVRRDLHERMTQPIWGWFGQTDQFVMNNPFEPRAGIGRLLNGTPGILGLVAARAGISLSVEAGIGAIASKAGALSSYAIDTADALGLTCSTSRVPDSSGGHVSIIHPDAEALQKALATRKVIVDKRDPDVLRLGLSPLTTRFRDVHDALSILAELVSNAPSPVADHDSG